MANLNIYYITAGLSPNDTSAGPDSVKNKVYITAGITPVDISAASGGSTNITVSAGLVSASYSLQSSKIQISTLPNVLSATYSLNIPTINTGVTISVGVLSSSYSLKDPAIEAIRDKLSVRVGSLIQPTSTGNQSISGIGFRPKVILIFANDSIADGSSSNAEFQFGVGVTSADRRSMGISYLPLNQNNQVYSSNIKIVRFFETGITQTIVADADFVSNDADGFTLNWTTADSRQRIINYVALGGSDLIGIKTGESTVPTSNGNKSVSGIGFKPDLLLAFYPALSQTSTISADATFAGGMGWASSPTSRGFTGIRNVSNANPSESKRLQLTDAVFALTNTSTISDKADLVSFDSDGFTLNWNNATGTADYFYYLVLKGVQAKVGSLIQPTSTGNQSISGLGFSPELTLLQSYDITTTSSQVSGNARFSIGAANNNTNRFSQWLGIPDATLAASVFANSDLDRTKIFKSETEGLISPTINSVADFVSNDADGFTLNWTTADSTQRQILYVTLGEPIDVIVSTGLLSATYSSSSPTIVLNNGVTISAGILSATYSIGASADYDTVITVTPLSATYSLPDPTISTGINLTVSVGVLSASYSEPSIQINTGVTTSPNILSGAYNLILDTINFGSTVSTGLLSASYFEPSVIINTGGNVTVQVGVLSGACSLNVSQINFGSTVSTGLLSASYSEPSVIINTGVTVNVGLLSASYALQNSQVNFGSTISPNILSASYSEPSPTIQTAGGVTVQVGVISGTYSEITPTIIGSATISIPLLSAGYSLQILQVNLGNTVSVNALTEIININNPTTITNSVVSVGVLTSTYSLQNPTFGSGNVIKLRRIEGY